MFLHLQGCSYGCPCCIVVAFIPEAACEIDVNRAMMLCCLACWYTKEECSSAGARHCTTADALCVSTSSLLRLSHTSASTRAAGNRSRPSQASTYARYLCRSAPSHSALPSPPVCPS
jgi:hypothetical protein